VDADPDPDPSFQIKAQTLRLIFHTFLACHLQIDADLDPVPDPAYHFDADPDVQVTNIMRIRIHNTSSCCSPFNLSLSQSGPLVFIRISILSCSVNPDPHSEFFF
jgi:hypothetical protein